jgi:hypothetical protein
LCQPPLVMAPYSAVPHVLSKFTTVDENTPYPPFEGGGGFDRRGLSPERRMDNPLAAEAWSFIKASFPPFTKRGNFLNALQVYRPIN